MPPFGSCKSGTPAGLGSILDEVIQASHKIQTLY